MLNNPNMNGQPYQDGINSDFTSLPCEAFSMASRINNGSIHNDDEFSHKNPMYQSAHVQAKSKPIVNDDESYHVDISEEGKSTSFTLFAFSCFFFSPSHSIFFFHF